MRKKNQILKEAGSAHPDDLKRILIEVLVDIRDVLCHNKKKKDPEE